MTMSQKGTGSSNEKDPGTKVDVLLEVGKGSHTLYDALGLTSDASEREIRKAYFAMAVKVHPDRNPGDEKATERFQSLQKIYNVLIDPEKRKLYDETGCLDEEGVLSEEKFESLYEYYKKQFKEVTTDAIDEFKESYQHSEEEMNDVLGYYEEFEGNMQKVFDHVMLSDPDEDAERFQKYVDDGLKDGRLSYCYDAYTQWKEKCSKKKSTRKKTLSRKKTKKGGDEQSLEQMILARRQEHSGLGNFAKRFGCDLMADDPLGSEEEFQKARARLDDARAKKTKR